MRVEVNSYTKKIKGATVLHNVSLVMESGLCYGLRGKNGSGKTMLLRAISGLIFPTSGYVSVDGKRVGSDIDFPDSLGILIETPSFPNRFTGFKNLQLLAMLKGTIGNKEIKETLVEVGLDPNDKRSFRKYSLGMRQRLGVAAAVMEKPDLILLDEPINALDPSGIECVERIIINAKNRNAIVVVACHDTEELHLLADEIFTMSEGQIIDHERVTRG